MKIFFILFLLLAATQLLWAAQKVDGFFITNQGDTVNAILTMPNYDMIQYSIYYRDANNVKKTIKAADTKEVQFVYKNDTIRLLSVELGAITNKSTVDNLQKKGHKGTRTFLKLEVDGNLQMFSYAVNIPIPVFSSSGPKGMVSTTNIPKTVHVLKKKDSFYGFSVERLWFNKNITRYFSDCPQLIQIINNQRYIYNFDNLAIIVKQYNLNCGQE